MTAAWLDANVILRFLTKDPPELAPRAHDIMRRAETGELALRVPVVVLAEVVWTLGSYYRYEKREIASAVQGLAATEGLELEEPREVLLALEFMADRNASFVDAYIAAKALSGNEPVCTFDTDFDRLGVEVIG